MGASPRARRGGEANGRAEPNVPASSKAAAAATSSPSPIPGRLRPTTLPACPRGYPNPTVHPLSRPPPQPHHFSPPPTTAYAGIVPAPTAPLCHPPLRSPRALNASSPSRPPVRCTHALCGPVQPVASSAAAAAGRPSPPPIPGGAAQRGTPDGFCASLTERRSLLLRVGWWWSLLTGRRSRSARASEMVAVVSRDVVLDGEGGCGEGIGHSAKGGGSCFAVGVVAGVVDGHESRRAGRDGWVWLAGCVEGVRECEAQGYTRRVDLCSRRSFYRRHEKRSCSWCHALVPGCNFCSTKIFEGNLFPLGREIRKAWTWIQGFAVQEVVARRRSAGWEWSRNEGCMRYACLTALPWSATL